VSSAIKNSDRARNSDHASMATVSGEESPRADITVHIIGAIDFIDSRDNIQRHKTPFFDGTSESAGIKQHKASRRQKVD
jgi:hypothetical protein